MTDDPKNSISEWRREMGEGFDRLDQKLDLALGRLDDLTHRTRAVERGVASRMDKVDKRLERIERRLDIVEEPKE